MKTLVAHLRNRSTQIISLLSIAAILSMASCGDDDSAPANQPGAPACRLVRETNTSTAQYGGNITYTYKSVFEYSYDDAGNIIGDTYRYNYVYSDGKTAASTSTSSSQFNAEGYVIRAVRQYNSINRDGVTNAETANEEYTYEKGRRTRYSVTRIVNGTETKYVIAYEYDAEGRIVKTTNTYDNSTIKIEYSGNTVSKLTRTDAAGNSSSPFLQYNSQGLLVKAIETYGGYTDEYRYTYTADNLLEREERYINGERSSGSQIEYDTKENPYATVYAPLKGAPKIPGTRPGYVNTRNYTRYQSLQPNADKTAFINGPSTIYVYDYNDKGFPTGYTSSSTDGNGAKTGTQTVTFEYSNCP